MPQPTKPENGPTRSIRVFNRKSQEKGASQLRLTVEEFKGHKFLKMQIWEGTAKGGFVPTAKVLTVRAAEMEDFLLVVQEAEGFVESPEERTTRAMRGVQS